MKNLLILLLIFICIGSFSQPATVYDRAEFSTEINNDLVPTLSLSTLEELFNKLDTSVVFREDVINTVVQSGGTATADFGDYDYIEVTQLSTLTLTISNISQGMFKFMKLTKDAYPLTLSGATLIGNSDYINAASDDFYFLLYNKDGTTTYCFPISKTIPDATETLTGILEVATTSEAQALTLDTKIITPSKLADVTSNTGRIGLIEIATTSETQAGSSSSLAVTPSTLSNNESWNTATITISGGAGTIKYRKNNIGNVEIYGSFTTSSANGTIFTLPSGYRPSSNQYMSVYNGDGDGNGNQAYKITITSTGTVGSSLGSPYSTSASNQIQGTIYLDN